MILTFLKKKCVKGYHQEFGTLLTRRSPYKRFRELVLMRRVMVHHWSRHGSADQLNVTLSHRCTLIGTQHNSIVKHQLYHNNQVQQRHSQEIMIKYLTQKEAQDIDIELMDESKQAFSVDQLMEMAGMSVSHAAWRILDENGIDITDRKILCVVGPGNNGGDALVAARHLRYFGAQVHLWIPKRSSIDRKELYRRLLVQCEKAGVHQQQYTHSEDTDSNTVANHIKQQRYSLIIDGIFGFSFDPFHGIRAPFDRVIDSLIQVQDELPILSIDIPSGWHVEKGFHGLERKALQPQHLISLTAPKLCAQWFQGASHWLGGRFVPEELAARYGLNLPPYQSTDIVQRLQIIVNLKQE